MSRLIIRIVVVLPHPDGPTSTTISPLRDVKREVPDGRPGLPGEGLGDVAEGDHRAAVAGRLRRTVADTRVIEPSTAGGEPRRWTSA